MSLINNRQIPEISVIVLCYRSGSLVKQLVDDLMKIMSTRFNDDFELVLVGNYHEGSEDITPSIVKGLALVNDHVTPVIKPKEGMMGWDMRSGLEASIGKNIAVIDGDRQMPIEDLIRVYDLMIDSGADLAKTYRITRGDGFKRIIISLMFNFVFKILFPGLKSRDINSKPKIFTRTAYEKLKLESDDWFIDAEIMIQARRNKFKIAEISTFFLGLNGSRRSFVRLPAILQFFKNLFIYRFKEFKYTLRSR